MSNGNWLEIIIVIVLTFANGFFAASEIAIVSARKGRLEQKAEAGDKNAQTALNLAENPNRFLSTVQVGITVISTLAAAFGGQSISRALAVELQVFPQLAPYAETLALILVVVVISYLSLIIGELVPKRLALQAAEAVAIRVAPVMRWLSVIASPVVSFLTFSTEVVLRLLGRNKVEEATVTEDDVIALVREGAEEGTLEQEEHDFISSVFAFTDRAVRSLMTPRTQVVAIDVDTPLEEVIQIVVDSGYSRLPVYQENLDHVIGILFVKDLLHEWGKREPANIQALIREPIYLLESQRAVTAFQQMKQTRSALAMVLDEYGQVAGVLSMEDMLEELVGDLGDEYDEADESIIQRDDGTYLVDGLLPFPEARERLSLPISQGDSSEGDFETFAGFLLSVMRRIPNVGDRVTWEGYTFEIVDMDGRRIDKVLMRPPDSSRDQSERVLASGALLPPTERPEQPKPRRTNDTLSS